jgi:hypothetical protein
MVNYTFINLEVTICGTTSPSFFIESMVEVAKLETWSIQYTGIGTTDCISLLSIS